MPFLTRQSCGYVIAAHPGRTLYAACDTGRNMGGEYDDYGARNGIAKKLVSAIL